MSSSKPKKMRMIQIDPAIGAALDRLVQGMTAQVGKRVTLRSVVEEALLARHPELRLMAQVATEPAQQQQQQPSPPPPAPVAAPNPEEYLMSAILSAVFSGSEELEQNAAIERLEGVVIGSYAQEIRLANLAYHLRSLMLEGGAPVSTLAELVADYEGGPELKGGWHNV